MKLILPSHIPSTDERFALLASRILERSIRTSRIIAGAQEVKPETLKRLQDISGENGNKVFFAEVFLEELLSFSALEKNARNVETANELLAKGEGLGMWVWVRPSVNCYKEDPIGHRTSIILPRGDWVDARNLAPRSFTNKRIMNYLENEESAGEELLKRAHEASLTVQAAHADFHAVCRPMEYDDLLTYAEKMEQAANGELYINGKRYVFDCTRMTPHLNLADCVFEFCQSFARNKITYHETRSTCDELFPSRSYTWFSLSPKWLRKTVTVKGEAIKCIDAKALHSNIVYKLLDDMGLNPPEFLTGDSHSKVAAILGITRAEAKIIALSFWNINKVFFTSPAIDTSKIENFELLKRFYDYLKEHNPEVLTGLETINKKFRFKDKEGVLLSPHKTLSRVLCAYETLVLAETIKKCRIHRIPVNSVYDAVYCPARKAEKVKGFFQGALDLFNIPTYGEVE